MIVKGTYPNLIAFAGITFTLSPAFAITFAITLTLAFAFPLTLAFTLARLLALTFAFTLPFTFALFLTLPWHGLALGTLLIVTGTAGLVLLTALRTLVLILVLQQEDVLIHGKLLGKPELLGQ